jgi:putative tryptophan/tyrosine transport system substrate-binding protein
MLLGLAAALAPRAAAQGTGVPRVGIISPADHERTPIFEAFRQGLRELGYVEGRNILLEFRFARGDYAALPRLAAELVALPADVIVTDGGAVVPVVQAATSTIPIVMGTSSADPVTLGLVPSLGRPGGNLTGFTLMASELGSKRIDLLHAAFPEARRLAILLNPLNAGAGTHLRTAEETARRLGLSLVLVEAQNPEALRALRPEQIGRAPVIVLPDAMFWNNRRRVLALVDEVRVPALYPEREYADDGGLMAYGPRVPDNFRRVAGYVDRILKGAKPGDLPIQEPSKLEFIVNLRTARALGVELPAAINARADEVIE